MSKYKPKNSGTPEVHSARSKLDGLLQTLVDKQEPDTPVKEEPLSPGEEEDSPDFTPTTPTKRGKQSRKRRRGRDDSMEEEMAQYHHTFVMKLFDRSVDLAQFDEDTPLFPICRAWMKNQPRDRTISQRIKTPSPDIFAASDEGETDDMKPPNIYRLPSPVTVKSESNQDRVPSPLPPVAEETLDIHADPAQAPPPETLLINHMMRWRQTRIKWKNAGRAYESRYENSLKIIKDIFESQCGKEAL